MSGVYYGPKVRMVFQPPDSPDLNIMDLGMFNNLWTKIHKILKGCEKITSADDVWEAAKVAWESITPLDIEILFTI